MVFNTLMVKDELYYNTYRQALSHENNYNAVECKCYPRFCVITDIEVV